MNPRAIEHEPAVERVHLRRENLQSLAAERSGKTMKNARDEFFVRSDGELDRADGRQKLATREHVGGAELLELAQLVDNLLGRGGREVVVGQGVDLRGEPGAQRFVLHQFEQVGAAALNSFVE